ncbi:hypothetical protein PC129_g15700 [Phytophthora cactorum]|uniref:Alpha/Beta hydrolase fold n=1 Tax=Phytophthora cactorum TaxID=29920 RepID=A0A329RPB3_9STRA|nr:hypothetical protein Pcac1_g26550 [Phytophthora cactorum]KAG2801856.1 hypothetical protein PC111_g19363 [Phytophthora cactorum]KAG2808002.1 hypothetical protein PC112_g17155 [Phytophthora cactorum]KAG2850105.1 hypothetical protein PC113_g17077 [Phytophthora cactorum]KAG2903912.1 hypothetical protein PC114_g12054 [Phytophthora cactorum]
MRSSLLAVSLALALLFALIVHVAVANKDNDNYQVQQRFNLQKNTTTQWPSLLFNFVLKRSSMKVHGHSEFSLVADPVVSVDESHVLYDIFATFTEDMTVHNYTFVNGTAYYSSSNENNSNTSSRVECLDPEFDHLPPINAIVEAINQATPVSSGSSGVVCSSGDLFKVTVNDINFALCASGSSKFTMYGSDMDITVENVDTRVNISTPVATNDDEPECIAAASPSAVTSTGKALLTGTPGSIGDSRRLKAEFDFTWGDDSSSCSCKSTPRPCIFIHGMGVPLELPDNQDSLSYWGNITGHTPCCSTVKYAVLDTINNTWTNNTQQHKVCDRALAVSKTSTDSVITDTIVVTHSMGNLMLAGAIASGKCSLDSSSTWVGIAAPMKGSKASDFIQESCAGNTNFVLEDIVENSGRCPPTTALKSMPYQGERHSTPEIDEAFAAAQEAFRSNVSALMCSSSFFGLRSSDQTTLWALGILGQHHSWKNDGMVEFQSCAVGFPESKFGKTWKDRFYRTRLNHYDMQFSHGDGLFSKAKMPLKWLECLL